MDTYHMADSAYPQTDFSSIGSKAPQVAPEPPPIMAESWRTRVLQLWLWFAAAVALISANAHMKIGLNNDLLDQMDQAQRLLAGGKPYVAYADVNPPLIDLLYEGILLLTRPFGMTPETGLYVVTLALIALGLFVSINILRYSGVQKNIRRVAISAMALALLSASFIHQPFADREHLMLLLATPFMVLYSPLARRKVIPVYWRIPAVAMAAVGFAIKPYFYVFYAAVAAYLLFSGRTWQSLLREWEQVTIGVVAVVYAAAIFLFYPEYTQHIFPLALHTYSVTSWDLNSKLHVIGYDLLTGYGAAAIAATALLLILAPRQYDRTMTYLYFLLAAGIASYLLNGGWYYTQYPFIAVATVMTVVVIARLFVASRSVAMLLCCGVLAAGTLACLASPMLDRAQWDIRIQSERGHPLENMEMVGAAAQQISDILDTHPRFIYLSHSLRAVNLLREGTPRANVGRFDYLWPMPGLLQMQRQRAQSELYHSLSDYFIKAMADDIEQQQPDVVINNISPYQWGFPPSFNPLAWLLQDAHFAGVWKAYTLDYTIDVCNSQVHENCAFEIYYRAPVPAE